MLSVPTLADVIKNYRLARNMSQGAFSRLARVDRQTISNIETGKTNGLRTDQFRGVAEAMGLTPEQLVERVGVGKEIAHREIALQATDSNIGEDIKKKVNGILHSLNTSAETLREIAGKPNVTPEVRKRLIEVANDMESNVMSSVRGIKPPDSGSGTRPIGRTGGTPPKKPDH